MTDAFQPMPMHAIDFRRRASHYSRRGAIARTPRYLVDGKEYTSAQLGKIIGVHPCTVLARMRRIEPPYTIAALSIHGREHAARRS